MQQMSERTGAAIWAMTSGSWLFGTESWQQTSEVCSLSDTCLIWDMMI